MAERNRSEQARAAEQEEALAPEQRAFGAVPKKPRLDSSAAHTTAGEAGQPTQCVYCDGGCEANGTAEARASIGVWFGEGDARNCSELLPPAQRQTSQSAELWAAIVASRGRPRARAAAADGQPRHDPRRHAVAHQVEGA